MAVPARDYFFESLKARILQRLSTLNQDWSSHESRLRDLAQNFQPRRVRWNKSDFNRGDDLNSFIINNAPLIAVRVASSGLLAAVANPTREWFRLTTEDPQLAEWGPVRAHLFQRAARIRAAMQKSTFYLGLADGLFPDLVTFGFTCGALEEHASRVASLRPLVMGEYRLACNENDEIDTVMQVVPMTVRQVIRRFALRPDRSVDRSKLSSTLRNLWDRGSYDTVVEVINSVQPNEELEPGKLGWRGMAFASKWMEKQADNDDRWLLEGGYHEFPFLAPRWTAKAGEAYGRGLGDEGLGDAKELQHEERRTGLMLDKIVNPPMVASSQTEGQRHSLVSGDVTFEPPGQGEGFRPAIRLTGAELEAAKDHILRTQDRLDRGFLVDLFIRLLQDTRNQRATATEIEELTQQTALQLGPALERLTPELLKRSVERYDAILERRGLMEPAPEELQGQEVKVEFISIMHQAQKGVGLGPLRIFMQEAAVAINVLGPAAADKIDGDEYIDQLAEMTGIAPNIVLDDGSVKAIRAARAQRQAATDAAAAAVEGAKAAKDVAQATAAAAPAGGGGAQGALQAVLANSSPGQATGAALTPLGQLALGGFPMGGGIA